MVTIIALNKISKVMLNQRHETKIAVLYNGKEEKSGMTMYIDNSKM